MNVKNNSTFTIINDLNRLADTQIKDLLPVYRQIENATKILSFSIMCIIISRDNQMKNFFRSMGVFIRSLPHFLLFEMLYKALLLAVGAPALSALLELTMKLSRVNYLDDESLLVYLHSPVTAFVLIIVIFISGFFTFIEFSALAACFTCRAKHEKLTIGGMILTGLKSFKKAFRTANPLKFAIFMLFISLSEFSLSSGVFMFSLLPLLRKIFADVGGQYAFTAYVLTELLFVLAIVRRSYSLHYLTLTNKTFPESIKASCEKIHRKRIKMAAALLLWIMTVLAATLLLTFGISFIIVLVIKGFSHPNSAFRTSLIVIRYTMKVFTAVSAVFAAPAVICWLTGRFLADAGDEGQLIIPDRNRKKMNKAHKAVLIASLSVSAILINVSFFRAVYNGSILMNTGIFSRTSISAHRGASSDAPENTRYAFEAAIESDTDYIELDVQLTKDGKLVVFHDNTIDRTTNGSGTIYEHTYAELLELSAGSWFSRTGEFDDAKIMTLEEALTLIGKQKKLNIEIKDTGDSVRATEKTVELIEKHNITGSCYVSSFSYPLLRIVKRLNPKIKTALIANVAVSTSYSRLQDIDAVSLNYIFINKGTVNSAHQNGKKVFVWTVDRREDIQQMIALGVDNIITNKPDIAAEEVYSNSIGDTILKILEIVFGK